MLVDGDEIRLRQVLTNLISNAIKFTEQGLIELHVDVSESINTTAQLRFEVIDTGIGIAKEKLQSVFQSFTQEDGSTTRKYGGTGLGLSISQQLVGLMNSVIHVNSESGIGSRFYFELSLPATVLPNVNKHKNFPTLVGKKVLIVDDVATNRELLQQLLNTWEIASDKVASGQECLQSLRQAQTEDKPYSIALLDYNMPEMNGLELAKAINNDETIQQIDLALLSCSSDINTELSAKSLGISTFLSKPVRQSELFNELVSLTARDSKCTPDKAIVKNLANNRPLPSHSYGRILVVEDTLVNQEVVSTMLDWFGYEYVIAADGAKALKIVEKQPFDAILMDCQMPVMDGFEATINIRKLENSMKKSRVPIIALTANAIKGDRERCLETGMDDYLAKPFNQQQLREMLLNWVTQTGDSPDQLVHKATGKQADPVLNANLSINKAAAFSKDNSDIPAGSEIVDNIELFEQEDILNTKVLDQFRQLQKPGRSDFIDRLIKAFFADAPKNIQNIIDAVQCSDPAALSKAAHALKSSSANMGATRLSAICKTLEIIGRSNSVEGTDLILDFLQTTYEKTSDCLNKQQSENLS